MNKEDRYDGIIKTYAHQANLPWQQIKAQLKQESAFDPLAVSPVGAKGLGQFMDPTWAEWGAGRDVFDPEANISATCRYMRWQMDRFNGDWDKALASYNWGIGNVRKLVARMGDKWSTGLPDETADYIRKVRRYYNEYLAKERKAA